MISKVYNKDTQQWEAISTENSDNIAVTDQLILEDPKKHEQSLTEVLLDLKKDIKRTKRNLSWVVQNGTLGGGGNGNGNGGVTTSNAKFKILGITGAADQVRQDAEGQNILCTTIQQNLELNYFIDDAKTNTYTLNVYLDSNFNTPVKKVMTVSKQTKSITIDDLTKFDANVLYHRLDFILVDSEDSQIDQYTVIVKDTGMAVRLLGQTPVTVIAGAKNTLSFNCFSKIYSNDITLVLWNSTNGGDFDTIGSSLAINIGQFNSTAGKPITVEINKENFNIDLVNSSQTNYVLNAMMRASTGETSDKLTIPIVKASSDTLVLSVSDLVPEEVYTVSRDAAFTDKVQTALGTMSFSIFAAQTNVHSFQYAVILHNMRKDTYMDVVGSWKSQRNENYNSEIEKIYAFRKDGVSIQASTQKLVPVSFPYSRFEPETETGDVYEILIYALAEGKQTLYTKKYYLKVKPGGRDMFPITSGDGGLQFAHWQIEDDGWLEVVNREKSNPKIQWTSNVIYGKINPERVTNTLQSFNVNGTDCGLLNNSTEYNGDTKKRKQSKLRYQNETYGIIDMRPWSPTDNWARSDSYTGFTMSFTFKADKMPYTHGTIVQIGYFDRANRDNPEGTFHGIRITLNAVEINLADNIKYTAPITTDDGVNTIDIVYDKTYKDVNSADITDTSSIIKIFCNGIIVGAIDLTSATGDVIRPTISDNTQIYLACRYNTNLSANTNYRDQYVDVNFYDINFYKEPLNDRDIVLNYLHNKAISNKNIAGVADFDTYFKDLALNFFTSTTTKKCGLWDNQSNFYSLNSKGGLAWNALVGMAAACPMPVVYLNCTNSITNEVAGQKFTREYYHTINPNIYKFINVEFNMFDPATGNTLHLTDCNVQIQGTSTKGYYSKNLEIGFGTDANTLQPRLVQVKNTWFPENAYTLKCDMVDSAHANNATIGRWINEVAAGTILEQPPAYNVVDANPPIDTHKPTHKWKTQRDSNNQISQYGPSVKLTLEGFQCIVLVTFADSTQEDCLGIYSFNLGRASYYNMGFQFFKDYSFRQDASDQKEYPLPAVVTTYHTYNADEAISGGGKTIIPNQIFSYEINNNYMTEEMRLFAQEDISMVDMWGDWKYDGTAQGPSAGNATARASMGALTKLIAGTIWNNSESRPQYSVAWDANARKWNVTNKGYSLTQSSFELIFDELVGERLCMTNVFGYYLIVMLFGLVDSLGKNCVFRSWNVGSKVNTNGRNVPTGKWYLSFYDLDTALSISNTGNQDVQPTAYTNVYQPVNDRYGSQESFNIIDGSIDGQFDQVNGWLWQMFEDSGSLYYLRNLYTNIYNEDGHGITYKNYYEYFWGIIRTTLLKNVDDFMKYFNEQVGSAGELLYNVDYNIKYLAKYDPSGSGGIKRFANIGMLHGKRSDNVREWLNKRLFFLDSVFDIKTETPDVKFDYLSNSLFTTYGASGGNSKVSDEAFNTDTGIQLIMNVSKPGIYRFQRGNSSGSSDIKYRFYIKNDVDTKIKLPYFKDSNNTQIAIYGSPNIQKLEGFASFVMQNQHDLFGMSSITSLDFAYQKRLDRTNAVNLSVYSYNGENSLRHIDLTNAQFAEVTASDTTTSALDLDLSACKKLLTLNASNSCITSLTLPESGVMQQLNVTNCTALGSITIKSQSSIDNLDFTGCTSLRLLDLQSILKLKTLNISNLPNLATLNIGSCPALDSIICTNHQVLTQVSLTNLPKLRNINFSNDFDPNDTTVSVRESGADANINLAGASNLNRLDLHNVTWKVPVVIYHTAVDSCLTDLEYLNLANSNVCSLKYSAIETNDPTTLLDLTPMKFILDHINYAKVPDSTIQTDYLNLTNNAGLEYLRFPNTKDTPFVPYPTQYNNTRIDQRQGWRFMYNINSRIKRIYGHIALQSNTFNHFRNLSINNNYKTLIQKNKQDILTNNSNDYQLAMINDGDKVWFDGDNVTNFTIWGSVLYCTFFNCDSSDISIDDVYYIFGRMKPACTNQNLSVTDLGSMFQDCDSITTNIQKPLKRQLFKWCNEVVSIARLFQDCGVCGPLYSHSFSGNNMSTRKISNINYDGLFAPLIKCTNVSYAFYSYNNPNATTVYIDRFLFDSPSATVKDYQITNIDWMSNRFYTVDNTNNYNGNKTTPTKGAIVSSEFLEHCPLIENIDTVLNGRDVIVYFDQKYVVRGNDSVLRVQDTKPTTGETYIEITPLLYKHPNMRAVNNYMSDITGIGKMIHYFGGDSTGMLNDVTISNILKLPSTTLTSIQQSFVINKFLSDSEGEGRNVLNASGITSQALNPTGSKTLPIFIDNDLLLPLTNLTQITYSGNAAVVSNSYDERNTLYVSFCGGASRKWFLPLASETRPHMKLFPYEIFRNNKQIYDIPQFFMGMRYGGDAEDNDLNITLPIPSGTDQDNLYGQDQSKSMFAGMKNLRDIEGIFRNLGQGLDNDYKTSDQRWHVKLVPYGFYDCNITNCAYAFTEIHEVHNNHDCYVKTGSIPYGLFYQKRQLTRQAKNGYGPGVVNNGILYGLKQFDINNYEVVNKSLIVVVNNVVYKGCKLYKLKGYNTQNYENYWLLVNNKWYFRGYSQMSSDATVLNNLSYDIPINNIVTPAQNKTTFLSAHTEVSSTEYDKAVQDYQSLFTDDYGWFSTKPTSSDYEYDIRNLGFTIDGVKYVRDENVSNLSGSTTPSIAPYNVTKPIIANMKHAVSNFYGKNTGPYKLVKKPEDLKKLKYITVNPEVTNGSLQEEGTYIRDLYIDNPDYDPIEYISKTQNLQMYTMSMINVGSQVNPKYKLKLVVNAGYSPTQVRKNESYDPFQFIFNKNRHDGNPLNIDFIKQSEIYKTIQRASTKGPDGTYISVTPIASNILFGGNVSSASYTVSPELFEDENDKKWYKSTVLTKSGDEQWQAPNGDVDKFYTTYYLCPPDYFTGCTQDADIRNAFEGSSGYCTVANVVGNVTGQLYTGIAQAGKYGIYGRICPWLFDPVIKTRALTNVFCGVNIAPYTWYQDTNDMNAVIYPTTLFDKLTELSTVDGLFAYTPTFWQVYIKDLFKNNTKLVSAQSLFAHMIYTEVPDDNLFANTLRLSDINNMFNNYNSSGSYLNKIPTCIDVGRLQSFTNVSGFLQFQSNAKGAVPEFWNIPRIKNNPAVRGSAFRGMRAANITNWSILRTLPSDWIWEVSQ